MMTRSSNDHSCSKALSGLVLIALLGPATTLSAERTRASARDPLDTILVQANRFPDAVRDEQLRVEVKTVLHDDPYFYDGHVTVTVKDGVVHLEGAVLDYGDIGSVLRIIKKKFPRVKRVVNELEVIRGDTDDG
jgi:osmotically-inducible protein OsmY